MWRTVITYYAVYKHAKVPDPVIVHSLNPQPKYRTFRAAGGNRKFKRTTYKSIRRKCIIVAKSSKVKKKKRDLDDEDLDDLEELEDLDDLDDEDDDEDDEPDDEDEEDDEDDEDDDGLDDETVKSLRAIARKRGHEPSDIRGKNKQALIDLIRAGVEEDDDEDDEDDEDEEEIEDDEEEDEEPAPKKKGKASRSSKSNASKKSSGPSQSRTTDGKVGVQEVAEAAGTDARKLRMVLRKHGIDKDPDVGRYEWPSLKNKEVLKIIKLVKGGAVKAATKESLDNLKASKGKTSSTKKKTDAPRKKKRSA